MDTPLHSQSPNYVPSPNRRTKSGRYQLADLKDADLNKCDWSRVGAELPSEDLAEIVELMKEGSNQEEMEREYGELKKDLDRLVSLEDLMEELETVLP